MDKKEEIFQYFPNFPLNTYPNKKYLMNVLNVRLCIFNFLIFLDADASLHHSKDQGTAKS